MIGRAKFETTWPRASVSHQMSGVDRAGPRGLVGACHCTLRSALNYFLSFTRLCEKAGAFSRRPLSFTPMLDECCAKGLD